MDSSSRPSKIPKCDHDDHHMNEPMAMTDQEEPFPSDLCLKLVFPFLEWKELMQKVNLVDKRWNRIAHDDAVWKTRCDFEMNLMKIRLENKAKWWTPNHPDQDINDTVSNQHTIMKKALSQNPRTKSYRDIFTVSLRMGHHFYANHARDGNKRREDQVRLEHIVLPTIETLRAIFGDPLLQHHSVSLEKLEMKKLLYDFASKDPRRAKMLQRQAPLYLEKEQLAMTASEYLLATATILSQQPGDCIFQPSSVLSETFTSFGEVIKTLVGLAGQEPTLCMAVVVKHTEQGFERKYKYVPTESESSSLAKFEWPISPADIVYSLIETLWPTKWDLERQYGDDWNEDQAFDDVVQRWWLSLAEPIRQILIDIYRRRMTGLPALEATSDLPVENLLIMLLHHNIPFFTIDLVQKFCEDIKADIRDELFKIFLQKSAVMLDTIRREYCEVYGDRTDETNAKLLVSIFLEVPLDPTAKSHAVLSSEYCSQLPSRRDAAFNRWDELVESAKSDDHVMWDPQTAVELDSLVSSIGGSFKYPLTNSQAEFDVSSLEKKFLYSVLAHSSISLPPYNRMRDHIKEIVEEYWVVPHDMMWNGMYEYLQDDVVFRDFAAFREHIHVREHAMIALIPLLKHLSASDSKKLVYAAFVNHRQSDDGVGPGFSTEHFGKCTFAHDDIPCGSPSIDHNLFLDAFRWIKGVKRIDDTKHETLIRLFGLPLPNNIVAAMAGFSVERLYQHDHPYDVDDHKYSTARHVLLYLERSVYENPEVAPIVWECLKKAIQNAINAVERWDEQVLENSVRQMFSLVVTSLLLSCITTRAVRALSTIRKLYNGTSSAILGQDIAPFRVMVQRIKESPPVVSNTKEMFDYYYL